MERTSLLLTVMFPRGTGKNHIHEMPLFRQYEYTRISMCSLLYIVLRQEVKIVEFYNAEGAPEFPKEMQEVFNFDSMSVEEFEKEWVRISCGDAL